MTLHTVHMGIVRAKAFMLTNKSWFFAICFIARYILSSSLKAAVTLFSAHAELRWLRFVSKGHKFTPYYRKGSCTRIAHSQFCHLLSQCSEKGLYGNN